MTERFQIVGSLLRPQDLLDYKTQIEHRDDIAYPFYDDLPGYREVEVADTHDVVAKEIEHGIDVLTDGEYTKSMWHLDFVWGLSGAQRFIAPQGYLFRDLDGVNTYETRRDIGIRITAPLSGKNHHFIDCWKRVVAQAEGVDSVQAVKQCIPSPAHIYGELSGLMSGQPHAGKAEGVYATLEELREGLLGAYKEFAAEYAAAGGTILQCDDCLWELFADDNDHSPFSGNGPHAGAAREVAETFVSINNEFIDYAHSLGLTVWTHNCRGNYESRNMSGGSYAAIAELFLGGQRYDRFFLEWDDERAGSVDALHAFDGRPGVEVVLGVLSSKTTDLDDEARAQRLLAAASEILPKENLYLSHQCGFASCDGGNALAADQQWAKIDQGRRIAADFWG
ncbi:cobalamin-independent methionine synthase II family protein [Brevibacterium moorei]|uniref:cobalamin-independent methionine synthase II family protein n=1 Tax=Brevibacterium moorei TaxID=2968457 RepID=UPI00211C79C5|nr:cobalamin-independent methionine synthase II family protein [Brevibacterium sp. 68QC2CO]MCQ9386597.1 cobalamin-independent methionine synthase II family protein [Brevibacterium sp. 68QC2CO]